MRASLEDRLGGNPYPWSGLIVGAKAGRLVCACFLTAAGETGRERVFSEEGDSLVVRAHGGTKTDERNPALYRALALCGGALIVSSGDQTDTICGSLTNGHSLQYAMSTRSYEPDVPRYTPRICALALPTGRVTFGIVRKNERSVDCVRKYWSYDLTGGVGRLFSTCQADGESVAPFSSEPLEIEIAEQTPEAFAERLWRALDPGCRVAVYARFTNQNTGAFSGALRSALS